MTRLIHSRLDTRLRRALHVGQQLRHQDTGQVWRIRQLHRHDCQAELTADGTTVTVPFSEIRTGYDLVIPIQGAVA